MDPPTQPNQRPKNTPSLSSSERKYHQYNKSESKRMTAAGYNKVGGRRGLPESYDNFDIILEYLISEGYADTDDAALAIMSNMSEYWFNSIVEQSVDSQGNRSHDLFTGASNPNYNSSNGTTTSKKPLAKKQPQTQMRDQPLF
jgi:hypothetical protein